MGNLTPIEAFTLAAERSKEYTGGIKVREVPDVYIFEPGTDENTLLSKCDEDAYIRENRRLARGDDHNLSDVDIYEERDVCLYGISPKYLNAEEFKFDPHNVVSLTINELEFNLQEVYAGYLEGVWIGNDTVCHDGYYSRGSSSNSILIPESAFDVTPATLGYNYVLKEPIVVPGGILKPTSAVDPGDFDGFFFAGIGLTWGSMSQQALLKNCFIDFSLDAGMKVVAESDGEIEGYGDYTGMSPATIETTIKAIGEYVDKKIVL